jgi:hypothetical protein
MLFQGVILDHPPELWTVGDGIMCRSHHPLAKGL